MPRSLIRSIAALVVFALATQASAAERLASSAGGAVTAPRAVPAAMHVERATGDPKPIVLEPDDAFSPSAGGANSVAVGDVTGDGRADLLVSNYGSPCGCPLDLYVQIEEGSLDDPVSLQTTEEFSSDLGIALGDLDGDDDLDVAVAVSTGIDWFEQDGGGLLDGVHLDSPGVNGEQVAIGDLDGDGLNDLIEVGTQLEVWLNSAGGFTDVDTIASRFVDELEVGDVTGDDAPDVILGDGSRIEVWENEDDGSGDLNQPDTYNASASIGGIALGDGNHDGLTDVMAGVGGNSDSRMNFFRQTSAGALATRVVYESKDIPDSADVADLNGDGRDDLIVGHGVWENFGVYLQKKDGTFSKEKLYATGYFNIAQKGIASGDLNGDGKVDIVLGDWSGQAHIWRQARPLTLSASSKVRFGQDIRWTATLDKPNTTDNKTVSLYDVVNGTPHLLTSGTIDAQGKLSGVIHNAKQNMVLRAEWDGDQRSALAAATAKVGVSVIATGTLLGSYGRAGVYRLYRPGDTPRYEATIKPDHGGKKAVFTLQRHNPGGWATISRAAIKLKANSSVTVFIRNLRASTDYRIDVAFGGDADHEGATSAWSYIRVT
jgi:hypothetical protein